MNIATDPNSEPDDLCRVAEPLVRRRLDAHQPQPLLTPEQPNNHSSRRKLIVPRREMDTRFTTWNEVIGLLTSA